MEIEGVSYNKKDKYDRIWEHITKGKSLNKTEARALEIAQQIYPLLCAGHPDKDIVKIIERAGICQRTQAYSHIRETKIIFAKAGEATKDGERQILIQMTKKAYQVALKKDDAKAMNSCVVTLAKLYGLGEAEQNLTVIYQKLVMPQIVISNDPAVIDQPFEEVDFLE